jgi:antitoxin VapB
MPTAKIFMTGRSQAVRLPKEFRFDVEEVNIRRDEITGEVILSIPPKNWDGFLLVQKASTIPDDFLTPADRQQGDEGRDPFAPKDSR